VAVAVVAERSVYHPRDPTASPLWRCLDVHYEAFRRNYPATFQETHGFFRPVVDEVVEDYLECGDLRNGFARIRCTTPGCGKEMLLAFSCKGRWFCPSCHEKKVLQLGEFAVGEVLYPVPHCQMVFTLPRMLRVYFRHHRKRLSALCRCAVESLQSYLRAILGLPDGAVGG
jgi:hypothetical protein